MLKRIYIVGAGFYGLTIAEQVASKLGLECIVFESRDHIGGNAYSYPDSKTGIEIHKYGSHIFHTNNESIWEYVNNFSYFNNYEHRVVVKANERKYTMPITLDTISDVYGRMFTPEEARELIESERRLEFEDNLEGFALNQVGRTIYELLIAGYTEKQWGKNPQFLPKEIIKRIPIRYNFDTRYFTDEFQGIPLLGYGDLFNNMVSNSKIKIELNNQFKKSDVDLRSNDLLIYSGPIDAYYEFGLGHLGWRTLDFDINTLSIPDYQGCSVINYADREIPFTRIHEFKHMHPERKKVDATIIAREFSRQATEIDEPYYPINSVQDRKLLLKYRDLIKTEKNVLFGGRLGSYQYLDMHMAIAGAMSDFNSVVVPWFHDN